ncbi:MAG: ABC transporter substrate-binding protein [Paracoccaceae bacterium]|nr:MAG: ABC transporter substrate-binding protein [Paracoccaceae bacterium]
MADRQGAVRVMTADGAARRICLATGLGLALIGASATLARGQDLTVSHGYSSFGELRYPADFPHLDYVNPDAPKGGEISIWSQGNFDSFNQYAREGVPAALNTIGSESILTSTADDPYGAYCFLCTTLEYPADLSFVTFNLRDDVRFSDGSPMTADDVAYSFDLFQTQGIPEYRRIVEGFIDAVEVEGPYRITFRFNAEAPVRDRVGFAGGTPVFSKAWFESTGTRLDRSSQRPFMSTGAYVLDSFDFNRQVIYARNPDYWGNDIPFSRGRNNFDRIRVEYFADSNAAFEGFKAGIYTFRTENSAQDWATGYNFPAIQRGWVVKKGIPSGDVATRLSWVFNLDRPRWQDPRLRRAIATMFNFEWSNASLYYDLYKRPVSFWSGTDLAATGVPGPEEAALLQPLVAEGLLPESILTDEAAVPPVHEPGANLPPRAARRTAGALLDEAGWPAGNDGIRRNAAGEVLTLRIIQFNPLFNRVVNPFIENLKELGIDASMQLLDTAAYVERRRRGDFDMTYQGFDMPFEPSIGLEQWFASKTADDSSRNLMRLRNPAVDRLIRNVIDAETLDGLKTAVRAVDRVLRTIEFDIPIYYNPDTWVAYYDMYRHPEPLPPLAVGQLDFWWFDAEAAARLRAAGAF